MRQFFFLNTFLTLRYVWKFNNSILVLITSSTGQMYFMFHNLICTVWINTSTFKMPSLFTNITLYPGFSLKAFGNGVGAQNYSHHTENVQIFCFLLQLYYIVDLLIFKGIRLSFFCLIFVDNLLLRLIFVYETVCHYFS